MHHNTLIQMIHSECPVGRCVAGVGKSVRKCSTCLSGREWHGPPSLPPLPSIVTPTPPHRGQNMRNVVFLTFIWSTPSLWMVYREHQLQRFMPSIPLVVRWIKLRSMKGKLTCLAWTLIRFKPGKHLNCTSKISILWCTLWLPLLLFALLSWKESQCRKCNFFLHVFKSS